MKKLLFLALMMVGISASSCEKEEKCFTSAKIESIDGLIIQTFENGDKVSLGNAGEYYTPFNNTCEL